MTWFTYLFLKYFPGIWDKQYGQITEENLPALRAKFDADMVKNRDKKMDKWRDACDIQDITIPGGDGQDLLVHIIRAKANKDKTGMCGQIHFHGGGGVLMKAEGENDVCARIATMTDVVMFNVDYRLAPETKAPGGAQDAVAAAKYFHKAAAEYGVDENKLTMCGVSGGSHIAFGAGLILGREGSKIIKNLFLWCPMIGNNFLKAPENTVSEWEKKNWFISKDSFDMLATDKEL